MVIKMKKNENLKSEQFIKDSDILDEVEQIIGEPCEMIDASAIVASWRTNKKNCDILDSVHPLCGNPYIRYSQHSRHNGAPGSGITVYKCREQNDVKYAVIWHRRLYSAAVVYVYPISKRIFFIRKIKNANKNGVESIPEPTINPETMELFKKTALGFIEDRQKLLNIGVKISRGIILTGPPGNGKTMLCAWVQSIFSQQGYDVERLSGAAIVELQAQGKLHETMTAYDVIIIDDIDVDLLKRTSSKSAIACDLLSAMDSNKLAKPVLRIITTNESIDDIDSAFLRPGRIDTIIKIEKPIRNLREQYINTWHKDILKNINQKDMDAILNQTENMSFAEMELVKSELASQLIFNGEWNISSAMEHYHQKRKEVPIKNESGVGFFS